MCFEKHLEDIEVLLETSTHPAVYFNTPLCSFGVYHKHLPAV